MVTSPECHFGKLMKKLRNHAQFLFCKTLLLMKLKYQLTSKKKRRATNDQFLLGVAAWRKTVAPIQGDHVNNLPLIRDSDIFSFLKRVYWFFDMK